MSICLFVCFFISFFIFAVSVDCESSSMTLTVKPEYPANGGAYVLGKTGCALVYDASKKMYSKKLDHKEDQACGDIKGFTHNVGIKTIIQYTQI